MLQYGPCISCAIGKTQFYSRAARPEVAGENFFAVPFQMLASALHYVVNKMLMYLVEHFIYFDGVGRV